MKALKFVLPVLALVTSVAQARDLSCQSDAGQDGPSVISLSLDEAGRTALIHDDEITQPILLQVERQANGTLQMRYADDANSPVIATLSGRRLSYVFRITNSGDTADAVGGQMFSVYATCVTR